MSWLGKLIGSATASGVSEAANGVGSAAIKLRTALTGDLPPEVKEKLAEIDRDLALAQVELNKMDSGSASLFRAGWRPAVGWTCVAGLVYGAIVAPVAGLPAPENELITTLLFSMLGLGALRTVEKKGGLK